MLQRVNDTANREISNLATDFFAGESEAWGIVTDRWGNLKRKFSIQMYGYWENGNFVLQEKFIFTDGEVDKRTWRLAFSDSNTFTATTPEVSGVAEGSCNSEQMMMKYLFDLRIGKRRLSVRFDDRMYRIDDETIANRAVMSKFGIRLGEISCVFRKV